MAALRVETYRLSGYDIIGRSSHRLLGLWLSLGRDLRLHIVNVVFRGIYQSGRYSDVRKTESR
jgi:hypothetical protein